MIRSRTYRGTESTCDTVNASCRVGANFMPDLVFWFRPPFGTQWTMAPACGTDAEPSINPAPPGTPAIYIIHNSTTNQTYVGYAGNPHHRWETRTEAFHCMGIERDYAKDILCACCIPLIGVGKDWAAYTHYPALEGATAAEHLLIRAVVNGLLGKTTSTNTKLGMMPYLHPPGVDKILVYLPTNPLWGDLKGERSVALPPSY